MTKRHVRWFAALSLVLAASFPLAGCGGDAKASGQSGRDEAVNSTAQMNTSFSASDIRFASNMVIHHRQTIEMAQLAGSRAGSQSVKDLASRIKGSHDPEITTLSGWLTQSGEPVPSAAPSLDGGMPGMNAGDIPGMLTGKEMAQLTEASGAPFDQLFLNMMIKHHQGAIDLATTEQRQGKDPQATQLAAKIAGDETADVTQMRGMLAK